MTILYGTYTEKGKSIEGSLIIYKGTFTFYPAMQGEMPETKLKLRQLKYFKKGKEPNV